MPARINGGSYACLSRSFSSVSSATRSSMAWVKGVSCGERNTHVDKTTHDEVSCASCSVKIKYLDGGACAMPGRTYLNARWTSRARLGGNYWGWFTQHTLNVRYMRRVDYIIIPLAPSLAGHG